MALSHLTLQQLHVNENILVNVFCRPVAHCTAGKKRDLAGNEPTMCICLDGTDLRCLEYTNVWV